MENDINDSGTHVAIRQLQTAEAAGTRQHDFHVPVAMVGLGLCRPLTDNSKTFH